MISQREHIEKDLLDANSSYAIKMSDVISKYITIAQGELAYGAKEVNSLNDVNMLKNEAERLRLQSGLFNSVIFVGDSALVLATSPESLNLVGVHLTSQTSKMAIKNKKPFISKPYKSAMGNLIILLSHPVFNNDGKYLGFIGGSIYLKEKSIFSDILTQHYFKSDTKVSIIDSNGNIIFSEDTGDFNRPMALDKNVNNRINNTEKGEMVISLAEGKYLVGYSHVKNTSWNVLVYSHANGVTAILLDYARDIIALLIIIIFIGSVTSSVIATRISSPLEKLAISTISKDAKGALSQIKSIRAWYIEADHLKKSLFIHIKTMMEKINSLNDIATKDPLTGVNNRLGFSIKTQKYKNTPGNAIIAIDIDHFKNVNDNFGHDTGDQVLAALAHIINVCCRTEDVVCRFGGEEFIIFLPQTSEIEAKFVAERIRNAIEESLFHNKLRVTVSAGVATQETDIKEFDTILKNADDALYQAKEQGRNRVVIYKYL